MKKLKTKQEDEIYYVGIVQPLEVRRNILETSKELLLFMQRYEKYKEVRNEKRQAVALLKAQMRDLGGMVSDLKAVLPQTALRAEERFLTKMIPPPPLPSSVFMEKTLVEKKVPEPVKTMSDIEKLEVELAEIEGRLKDLT